MSPSIEWYPPKGTYHHERPTPLIATTFLTTQALLVYWYAGWLFYCESNRAGFQRVDWNWMSRQLTVNCRLSYERSSTLLIAGCPYASHLIEYFPISVPLHLVEQNVDGIGLTSIVRCIVARLESAIGGRDVWYWLVVLYCFMMISPHY